MQALLRYLLLINKQTALLINVPTKHVTAEMSPCHIVATRAIYHCLAVARKLYRPYSNNSEGHRLIDSVSNAVRRIPSGDNPHTVMLTRWGGGGSRRG